MTHRAAARVVGALFITATGSIILSVVLLDPVVDAPDFLTQASVSEARVAAGVLLELVNNIAVVGIAVVIYPVLKPFSERLALGYVAARSIESVLFTIGTGHLLTLLLVSHEFVAAGSSPCFPLPHPGRYVAGRARFGQRRPGLHSIQPWHLDAELCAVPGEARASMDIRLRSSRQPHRFWRRA